MSPEYAARHPFRRTPFKSWAIRAIVLDGQPPILRKSEALMSATITATGLNGRKPSPC